MYLTEVRLTDFRNYSHLRWRPGAGANVIAGANAAGKTNLLEGIFFGLTARSFRAERDREVIRHGCTAARAELRAETAAGKIETAAALSTEGKKNFTFNGHRVSPAHLPELPPPVIFNPDHLSIIKGGPQQRRRFMDLEMGGFVPGYLHNWHRYQQVLAQRNELLRRIREKTGRPADLHIWNEQLCQYGGIIVAGRLSLLAGFTPLVREIYNRIAGDEGKLVLSYRSSFPLAGARESGEIAALMCRRLSEQYAADIARGQTTLGPHRDDLLFTLNDCDVRLYASRGQQRSIVLALKLAQVELSRREYKEYPPVLLDDVLSELDRSRRRQLLSHLCALTQTFITTSEDWHGEIDAPVIYIYNGRIEEE